MFDHIRVGAYGRFQIVRDMFSRLSCCGRCSCRLPMIFWHHGARWCGWPQTPPSLLSRATAHSCIMSGYQNNNRQNKEATFANFKRLCRSQGIHKSIAVLHRTSVTILSLLPSNHAQVFPILMKWRKGEKKKCIPKGECVMAS
ncbi:unnamed protein product [Rhodiola kirilowii]